MKKSYTAIGSIAFAFIMAVTGSGLQAQIVDSTGVERSKISVKDTVRNNARDTIKTRGIEEVILNAGYYKVRDKERTGSIAKISSKDIANQPVTNVLSAAQGRMAGVNIVQNGGTPGGGFKVEIRGQNSLRTLSNSGIDGNVPLYVVDGVPIGGEVTSQYSGSAIPLASINPLNTISPQDIESVEILKDADATAIYGSRGANGVVLVTTKRGRAGKPGLQFSTLYSLSRSRSNLTMMDTQEYLQMRRQAYANSNITTYPATAYDVNATWDQNRYTDWRKELLGNLAAGTQSQLSLSGGSEATTFLVSYSHQEQTTVYGSDFRYKTNNLSGSLNHRSKDRRLTVNFSTMFSGQDNRVLNEDLTRTAHTLSPNAPALYKPDGSINWENNTFNNPVAAFNAKYRNTQQQFLNNLSAEYALIGDLKLRLIAGLTYQAFEEKSIRPNTIYNPAFATGQSSAFSQSSLYQQKRLSYILEPQLNWNKIWGRHRVDLLTGATYQDDNTDRGSMTGTGFESNAFIENIAAAQTKVINDQTTTEYRYAAAFGRINYQLDKRYIVNVTGRRDGSSRFGPGKRFANFGAVGAAWIFTDENFFKKNQSPSSGDHHQPSTDSRQPNWLSFGKLRGSFGTAGSDNIGDYQYIDAYAVSTSAAYNGVSGLIPSRLYNPNYSWEKTVKLEMALDLGFFSNRLNLTAAWYRNRSSNQLIGYQLSAVTGFTSVNANLDATVENSGTEITLNASLIKKASLRWDAGFNLTVPRNRLISFPGLEGSSYANSYVIGQPVNIIRLYNLEGISAQTGQYVFTDFNGDGKISSPEDRQVIENLSVDLFGGFNSRLGYKNLSLDFLFQFVKQRSRNYNASMTSPGLLNNLPVEALDVWSPENPGGQYMPYRSSVNPLHSLFQTSTATVSDASFVRLKNIRLGYSVPVSAQRLFKSAEIYVQGQNLWTWTKYFGIDPELGASSFLPPLKTWSFGMQLTL